MRFAATLLCVSFAGLGTIARAAPSPGLSGAESLQFLVDRARAASGAPYRFHVVSVSHESHGGRSFEITTETEGDKFRTRRCSKSICSGSYFDGERSFDSNLNDTALPRSARVDAVAITLRAIVSYAFTAPDFQTSGGRIAEREPIARNGRTDRRIAIAAPRGAWLDALLDPATGLVVAVISTERDHVFELEDQRRVAGRITLPFRISLDGSDLERFDSREIASAPLETPPGLRPTLATDPQPVAMIDGDRPSAQPVVPCSIGGQNVRCLLDTGNSGLAMSLELAERLDLEIRGGAFDVSGLGRYVTGVVGGPALTVGPATYGPALYIVLPDLRRSEYDVVLGADVFAHARIALHYGTRAVTFAAESQTPSAPALPLQFENFIPVLSVRLDDDDVTLAVDTGDESTINLDYDYYEEHPALFKPTGSIPVAGIGGVGAQLTGEIASARIGDFELGPVPIGATKGATATAHGHIGAGFLRNFDVTFDYARAGLELTARADVPQSAHRTRASAGVGFGKRSR